MRTKRGITLIELMISMAVLSVIMGVIFSIYMVSIKIYTAEGGAAALRQDAEGAMYSMVEDFRLTKEITAASDLDITVWVDSDLDEVQDADELITYSHSGVSGDPLVRTQNAETTNKLYGVTDFELTYDSVVVANIRLITIDVSAELGDETINLTSKVKPRNIYN